MAALKWSMMTIPALFFAIEVILGNLGLERWYAENIQLFFKNI